MYREPKLPHVLCGLSFCEACHFVRPIPVCKYTQSRRSRVVNMKQICQRSKAEWSMLCIYVCKAYNTALPNICLSLLSIHATIYIQTNQLISQYNMLTQSTIRDSGVGDSGVGDSSGTPLLYALHICKAYTTQLCFVGVSASYSQLGCDYLHL